MTPAERFAQMISNQPGASAGLDDPGPLAVLPPVSRTEGPPPGVEGPDNEPGLDDSQIYAEFRKPSGELAWLQKDNRAVYEAKGFRLTGNEMSIDAWNRYAGNIDRWRGVGNDQSSSSPPLFPGPLG